MLFLLSQLLFIIYTVLSVEQEKPVIKAMTDYVPHGNPYSDPFHFWGSAMTGVVLIISSLFANSVLVALSNACIYWILFDGLIGKEFHNNYFYLGNTSKIDRWLVSRFGNKGGKIKAGVCVVTLVVINLIYFL